MTRAIAEYISRILPPGQTAADLKDDGSRVIDKYTLLKTIIEVLEQPPFLIEKAMLDYITAATDVPRNTAVSLLDGRQVTYDQAEAYYTNLASNWIARFGGGERGRIAATKSIIADCNFDYIAWYAQRDALQNEIAADLAVLGHAHIPKLGLRDAMIDYVNGGFMCSPIISGQLEKPITFAELDLQQRDYSIKSVVKQSDNTYQIIDISKQTPSDSIVYGPEQDFSCYISIYNNGISELSKTEAETEIHGYYVVPPPQTISPGKTAQFWIQNELGVEGTEGNVPYADQAGGKTTPFKYSCSPIMGNKCSPEPFEDKNSNSDWTVNHVVEHGHPYFVNFSIGVD